MGNLGLSTVLRDESDVSGYDEVVAVVGLSAPPQPSPAMRRRARPAPNRRPPPVPT
jgi:hypothetical protein